MAEYLHTVTIQLLLSGSRIRRFCSRELLLNLGTLFWYFGPFENLLLAMSLISGLGMEHCKERHWQGFQQSRRL